MPKKITISYEDIISLENLLLAWREFAVGKRRRRDIQRFEQRLMDNVIALNRDLQTGNYEHSSYAAFTVSDPKTRHIHKATVRDRLLHRAIYRQLYAPFDAQFIADSFSCRKGRGTHRAMNRFRAMARKASRNHTRTLWVLQCDVRKFFASVNHAALLDILRKAIVDHDVVDLLGRVICSYSTDGQGAGLPLGNITSQLFANVYLNEFDRFMKHDARTGYYIRYADDFAVMSDDRLRLERLLPRIEATLRDRLRLELHPSKVRIKTLASGVDFLGWVHFPSHRVLRTPTRRRMLRAVGAAVSREARNSYAGMLKHGNARKLERELELAVRLSRRDVVDGCVGIARGCSFIFSP